MFSWAGRAVLVLGGILVDECCWSTGSLTVKSFGGRGIESLKVKKRNREVLRSSTHCGFFPWKVRPIRVDY